MIYLGKLSYSTLALASFLTLGSAQAEVVISEFLASSSGLALLDEDSEDSDWIEIHNTGANAVSLAGYSLSDDSTDLTKWTFPNVTIAADSYLIVFASGKNRAVANSELHTNFGLSAGGEYLALINDTGAVISAYDPEYPQQTRDISYGIGPDNVTLGYFTEPSPGAANSISLDSQVEDTDFSVQRGIYDTPFTLSITSATLDSEIRYTTDGSTPTATNGFIFSSASPIAISETTTIRAAAFKQGFFPTNVDTQTYLFPDDVRTQYANGNAPAGWPSSPVNNQVYDYGMDPDITGRHSAAEMIDALTAIPSVMLTTDIGNLTSAANGIYSNPGTRGLEHPGHIEFLGGPNSLDVSARCGLRLRGGASRRTSNPKHSFRVFFRSEYGDSTLDYPLFEADGVDEFKRIDFRTAQNYSWSGEGDINNNTFLREVLGRDLQAAAGQPHTRSRYYHLYLNGVYWGLFMSQERAEANWGSSYLGGNDDDYDSLKTTGSSGNPSYSSEATDGDLNGDWRTLWDMIQAQAANPTTERYLAMQGLDANGNRDTALPVLLDVDNLIDYMLIIGFTGSYDSGLSDFIGAANNWYAVRNTADDDRGFANLVHDAEHSLGAGGRWANANDRINTTNGMNRWNDFAFSNPQVMHIRLAQSTPEYRLRFADKAQAALSGNGYLTRTKVLETLEKRRAIVDQVIIAESARWGDARRSNPADKENWESAVASLTSLFDTRSDVFIGHLRLGNLYPDTPAPSINPIGNFIDEGDSVFITGSGGTTYYTLDGTDPRLSTGGINPTAMINPSTAGNLGSFPQNSVWRFDDGGSNRGASSITEGANNYDSSNWKHPDFNDSGWSSGPGILGFGGLGANGATATISTSMGTSNNITSYLRREFNVNDVNPISSLTANLLAEDAAIIYINGQEAHRQNMNSDSISFTDTAISALAGAAESTYNNITLDPQLLVAGSNTIAVELHQASATSSDLGFDLSLSWNGSAPSSGIPINSPLTINARTLNNGEWSALVTNYYTTSLSPQLGQLLISEVNYHPADPSTPAELAVSDDDDDFEFIEIVNISPNPLELMNSALAEQVIGNELEGARFTFENGQIINSGERLVIVSNTQAFLARYPNSASSIVGEFSGSLSNGGESLRLINDEGVILASFEYDDRAPFPTEADGDGPSLQLADLRADVDYSDPLSWVAVTTNGSPGNSDTNRFTGDLNADNDGDGVSSLLEYFSGTSDQTNSVAPPQEVALGSAAEGSGILFSFVRDPETFGVNAEIEHSTDLSQWDAPPAGSQLLQREVLPDGNIKETYQVNPSAGTSAREFLRLNISVEE